jgi:hypothetical protein
MCRGGGWPIPPLRFVSLTPSDDKFPPTNTPSAEVARKAREKFGWLAGWEEIAAELKRKNA